MKDDDEEESMIFNNYVQTQFKKNLINLQAAQQVVQSAPMLSQHYGEIITLISEKTVAKL